MIESPLGPQKYVLRDHFKCINQPGDFTCECKNGFHNRGGLCEGFDSHE